MQENNNNALKYTHSRTVAVFTMKLCRDWVPISKWEFNVFSSLSFYSLNWIDIFFSFDAIVVAFFLLFFNFFLNDPNNKIKSLSTHTHTHKQTYKNAISHCCDAIEIKFKLYRLKANQRHNNDSGRSSIIRRSDGVKWRVGQFFPSLSLSLSLSLSISRKEKKWKRKSQAKQRQQNTQRMRYC